MNFVIADYKNFWEYLNAEIVKNKLEPVYVFLERKTYDTQYDFETLEHFTEVLLIIVNDYIYISKEFKLFYKIIQAYPAYNRKRKIELIK